MKAALILLLTLSLGSRLVNQALSLTAQASKIVDELLAVQEQKANNVKADDALRPNITLNGILAGV
jgi:hypothetical protein